MPEILLGVVNIRPENVPPIARGTVEVHQKREWPQTPKEAEWLTRSVRSMLYPGWENYERYPEGELPERLYPFYRVFCQTPEQAFVADILKPRRAVVDIVMIEDFQRMQEEENMNPLIRKVKSVNPRYWSATNIALTGFSIMSFLDSIAFYRYGSSEMGNQAMALGITLGLTSMAVEGIRNGYLHLPHIEIPLSRNQNHRPAVI